MSTRDEPWPAGTPAWVDLMVPDRTVARDFYGPLLGWEFDEGPAETGYYTQCLVRGRTAAGIGEAPPGEEGPPPVWTTYLAADDLEAATARVAEAGGSVLMEPMAVGAFGRMAVAADPTGAVFGLWQSGEHTGARIVNEPGSVVWNEVMTHDYARAKEFYAAAFGYSYEDMSGDGFDYSALVVDGRTVGGLGAVLPGTPAGTPSHWMTYFEVADVDAATSTARDHGGHVVREPWDSPYGRMACLTGPSGELFTVMQGTGGDS